MSTFTAKQNTLFRPQSVWLAGIMAFWVSVAVVCTAAGAQLEKFALSTGSQGVGGNQRLVVKLQTDMDTSAKVEYGAKGAIIHLKDAALSESMLNAGLPMVMDENNRFIGRAVPGGDEGGVKLVIPNVRPGDVQVQIQQVRQLQTVGSVAPVQPVVTPSESVGQFRAAASAAQASLNKPETPPATISRLPKPVAVARPPIKTPVVKPMRMPPTTSVVVKPQVVPFKAAKKPTRTTATKTRRLPTVVTLKPPVEETKVATAKSSEEAKPTETASSKPGYAADTSWFSNEDLPTVSGNDYGVLAMPATTAAGPPEPAAGSIFSGLASFLDNVSGNLFSRPYGLAFWGLMLGVILFGALGFVLLAVGVYLFRASLRSSKPAPAAPPTDEDQYLTPQQPAPYQANVPYGSTVDKYSKRQSPQRPSPFATMRQARSQGASAFQAIMPVLQARGSLRERLRAANEQVAPTRPVATSAPSNQQGLRSRLKPSAGSASRAGYGTTSPIKKPPLQSLAGRMPIGAGVGSAASTRASGAATVKDAVSSVLKWI